MVNETSTIAILIGGPIILATIIGIWWFVGGYKFKQALISTARRKEDMKEKVPALYKRWNTYTFHILFWPTIILTLGLFLFPRSSAVLAVPLIVIWILLGFVLISAFKEYTRRLKFRAIVSLLDDLLGNGRARELDGITVGLLEIGDARIIRNTMETMMSWGSPTAIGILREIRAGYHTTMPPIFYSGLRRLIFDLDNADPNDMGSMIRLTRHTRFWRVLADAYKQKGGEFQVEEIEEMAPEHKHLSNFYRKNQELITSFPDVFCTRSRRRAILTDHGFMEVVSSPEGEFNDDLMMGVKEVVGQIGGENDWQLENGVLQVQMWNAEDKKVAMAEIDTLEVLDTADDWAVVAVLDKLTNYRKGRAFKVQMHENAQLSANTIRILEDQQA